MKRLAFIFFLAAVFAHALGSFVGGSFNPAAWDALLRCTIVLIVAPLLALALAVMAGALE